uniref:Uncharacterized protein n=1 Tax=Arundo donax TaxID=35708 RepID=A0A0A8YSR9_ARUDO
MRLKSLGSSCCGRCPVFGITFTVAFSPSFSFSLCAFSTGKIWSNSPQMINTS